MLRINSIISSFMGEQNAYGIGTPCTIVRLQGCSRNCYGCDTFHAKDKNGGKEMSEEEIYEKIKARGNKVVLITGGEPLEQDLGRFFDIADTMKFDFVIETNGVESISPFEEYNGYAVFVMDYKLPGSGIDIDEEIMNDNISYLSGGDYIKFVLRGWVDYHEMKRVLEKINYRERTFKVAAGVHDKGAITLAELADKIITDKLEVSLNPQLHKLAGFA